MKKDEAQNTAAFIQDRDLKLTQRSRDANHRGALPHWNDTQMDSKRVAMGATATATPTRPEISTRAASVAQGGAAACTSDACAAKRSAFFDAYDAAADCLTGDDLKQIAPSGASVSICMLLIAIALSFAIGLYAGNASK